MVFAQEKKHYTVEEKTFEQEDHIYRYQFYFDLGKGNKIKLQLDAIGDIAHFSNLDSLLQVFLEDIKPFRDSLLNDPGSVRIDYVTDSANRKKIRILRSAPKGKNYLIRQGELSALKLEQDTVNIIGSFSHALTEKGNSSVAATKHYKLSCYLNSLDELEGYTDGRLTRAMSRIQEEVRKSERWINYKNQWVRVIGNASVSKDQVTASVSRRHRANTYLSPLVTMSIQNYKNYFVPSFGLGALVRLGRDEFNHDFKVTWEPLFLFAKNAQGELKTYRNDFIVASYALSLTDENNLRKNELLKPAVSLGYLINRNGDYFEKHSFRFGMGEAKLFNGKTRLEPVMYFHDFFRGVTPGLRLTQRF